MFFKVRFTPGGFPSLGDLIHPLDEPWAEVGTKHPQCLTSTFLTPLLSCLKSHQNIKIGLFLLLHLRVFSFNKEKEPIYSSVTH